MLLRQRKPATLNWTSLEMSSCISQNDTWMSCSITFYFHRLCMPRQCRAIKNEITTGAYCSWRIFQGGNHSLQHFRVFFWPFFQRLAAFVCAFLAPNSWGSRQQSSLGHWWRMWGTNISTLRSLPRLRTEALTLAFARLAKCNETFAKYPAKNWIRLTHISNNLGTERLRTLVGDGVRICFFWFMLVLHHFSHFSWCHSFITGVVVNQWYRAEFLDVTQPLAYRSFFNTKLFDQCPGWKQWEAAVVFCSFLSRVVGFQSFSEVFHQLLPGRQLVPQSGKGELENIGKLGEDLNSKCKIKNYSILSSNKQHESKMTNDKSIVCT